MYLALTDGVTTLSLTWTGETSPYQLAQNGWTPAIATHNADALAPRRYTDVSETITLHIHGTSASDARNNLANLIRVCEAGARWLRGERRADWPLRLVYLPTDGAPVNGDHWSAVCFAEVNRSAVAVAPTYHQDTNSYVIQNVQVRVTRYGRWLGPRNEDASYPTGSEELRTVTVGTNGYGRRYTLSLTGGSDDILSPYVVVINRNVAAASWGVSYLLFAGQARDDGEDALWVYAANGAAGTSGYTSAASAYPYSTHGNVLRFKPPVANAPYVSNAPTLVDGATPAIADRPTVLWLASMRNVIASGTPTYTVTLNAGGIDTPEYFVETTDGTPFIAVLGATPSGIISNLTISGSSTAVGNYLEIDNIVCIDVSRQEHAMIAVTDVLVPSYLGFSSGEFMDAPQAHVGRIGYVVPSGLQGRYAYAGSPELNGGASVQIIPFSVAQTEWRPNRGGAAEQPNLYGFRRRACLIPE